MSCLAKHQLRGQDSGYGTAHPHGHDLRLNGVVPIGSPYLEVVTVLISAVLVALAVGYLAGLWSFKVKNRWCPQCGATTSDLAAQHAGRVR